ncbi:MAG: TerC family protein [Elusimicrobia bacterium]|nr:TerC family protein [Elusimicrobiota bacterium]MBU2614808.1 TerC family protein [Elusimicrobiota bacterium]
MLTSTWIIFNVFVVIMLMLDLGVFHKGNRAISIKESLVWSIIWIAVALVFNGGLYYFKGSEKALEFLTVYIVERSLSVDNIFVFLLVFSYFGVKAEYQYKILFWGIIGALVMRAVFIVAGVALIAKFHWMIYLFGGLLVYIGVKMWFEENKEIHPENNIVLKVFKKIFPVSDEYVNGSFFVKSNGKCLVTPLFLVLLVIETTDIIFAVDSIPAALAISTDSFIIYSANVFAILGLRALYFALAGCMQMFKYLQYGLSLVLSFVGVKMILADVYKISITASLGFIAVVLSISVILSFIGNKKTGQGKTGND